VYIPQYSDKTASLNVAVATSIVIHNFALFNGYDEVEYEEYVKEEGLKE